MKYVYQYYNKHDKSIQGKRGPKNYDLDKMAKYRYIDFNKIFYLIVIK